MASPLPVPTGPTIDRRQYLGASEVAAVVGIHPYRTELDVWASKVHGIEVEHNPQMKVGMVLERPILEQLYAPTRDRVTLHYPGTMLHAREKWAGATPDALEHAWDIVTPRTIGDIIDIQVKVVGRGQFRRWEDEADGPDAIPPEVLAQVQWEMEVAQAVAGRVVALLGTDLRVYEVPRDPNFAADLLEIARAWWRKHIIGGEMPEITAKNRDTIRRLFPRATGALLAMREDIRIAADAYGEAERARLAAGEECDLWYTRLVSAIGNDQGFEAPDLRVTYKEQRGRINYGAAATSLGIPAEQLEPFRGAPFRVLRVHRKEEE